MVTPRLDHDLQEQEPALSWSRTVRAHPELMGNCVGVEAAEQRLEH
jgi:hypothetical protein